MKQPTDHMFLEVHPNYCHNRSFCHTLGLAKYTPDQEMSPRSSWRHQNSWNWLNRQTKYTK